MRSPGEVLDWLDREGYRELSPMAHRGDLYKLTAVNPDGDVVALEISVYTGELERELILETRRDIAPEVVAPPSRTPPATAAEAPPPMRDRLRAATQESREADRDPLVVY
jgi:hypothetical protein